jgi:radical SAM protein with 4Fe4S-binding SPASM domain
MTKNLPGGSVAHTSLPDLPLWGQAEKKRVPLSFDLELTARCNNNCSHCYINLPAADEPARQRELSVVEIDSIASQAVALGTLWCLITGGEPLLRPDFAEIYLLLKRKGLLVSVFTNACLVTPETVRLFRQYPPRDIEVTVYGATQETYERVSRKPGSYHAFRRGLDLLIDGGVKVRLKAMALRSNLAEMDAIARFCRERTNDFYRFDPQLHLRYDGDAQRNAEIRAERLTPQEVAAIEQADPERSAALQQDCADLLSSAPCTPGCAHLFHCGAGQNSFSVGFDGTFYLCSSLRHPDTTLNLRQVGLKEAWTGLVPRVRALESHDPDFLTHCRACPLVSLCLWCPANAHLESGRMDGRSEYFCQAAAARAAAIRSNLTFEENHGANGAF